MHSKSILSARHCTGYWRNSRNSLKLCPSSRSCYSGEGGTGEQAVVKGWVCAVRRVSKGCFGDPVWGGHLTSSGWSGGFLGEWELNWDLAEEVNWGAVLWGIGRHGQQCQLGGWSGQSGGAPRVSKTRERTFGRGRCLADTLLHGEQSGWFAKFQNVSSLSPLCMESRWECPLSCLLNSSWSLKHISLPLPPLPHIMFMQLKGQSLVPHDMEKAQQTPKQ